MCGADMGVLVILGLLSTALYKEVQQKLIYEDLTVPSVTFWLQVKQII